MNTVCGECFRRFVKVKIEERNNKLADLKDLTVEMDPEVKAAFLASSHISCKLLISYNSKTKSNQLDVALS